METIDFKEVKRYDINKDRIFFFTPQSLWADAEDSCGVEFFGRAFATPEHLCAAMMYGNDCGQCAGIQDDIADSGESVQWLMANYIRDPMRNMYMMSEFGYGTLKYNVMMYAVWLRCQQDSDFARALARIPSECPAVCTGAEVTGDERWGCTPCSPKGPNRGVWIGCNAYGRILSACRDALSSGSTPPTDFSELNSSGIHLFGKKVAFG